MFPRSTVENSASVGEAEALALGHPSLARQRGIPSRSLRRDSCCKQEKGRAHVQTSTLARIVATALGRETELLKDDRSKRVLRRVVQAYSKAQHCYACHN